MTWFNGLTQFCGVVEVFKSVLGCYDTHPIGSLMNVKGITVADLDIQSEPKSTTF
jgi:hypothetical protein